MDEPPELFRYALADYHQTIRLFVPFIEAHLPDELAWEAQFSDPSSPHYDPMHNVDVALVVYGRKRLMHPARRRKHDKTRASGQRPSGDHDSTGDTHDSRVVGDHGRRPEAASQGRLL